MALFLTGGFIGFIGMSIAYSSFPVLQMIPIQYYSVFTLIVTAFAAILNRLFFGIAIFLSFIGIIGGFLLYASPKVVWWFQNVSVAETLDIIKSTPRTYPINCIEEEQRNEMIKNMKEYKK